MPEEPHVSPLRNVPSRRYIFDEDVNSTGNDGRFTVQTLYRNSNRSISCIAPPESDILNLKSEIKASLINATKQWADYLDIGSLKIMPFEEMLKLNIEEDNITDVGFGISQGLPILVSGLMLKKHETLMLEQPEIHLHPNMQMKMADLLISLAFKDKNIIVETHSDHIINRITRRVMEDKYGVLQKLIRIYFIQRDNEENRIYKDIVFDPIDGIVNAPDGFFTQFGSEFVHITKIGMMNAKEGIKW